MKNFTLTLFLLLVAGLVNSCNSQDTLVYITVEEHQQTLDALAESERINDSLINEINDRDSIIDDISVINQNNNILIANYQNYIEEADNSILILNDSILILNDTLLGCIDAYNQLSNSWEILAKSLDSIDISLDTSYYTSTINNKIVKVSIFPESSFMEVWDFNNDSTYSKFIWVSGWSGFITRENEDDTLGYPLGQGNVNYGRILVTDDVYE